MIAEALENNAQVFLMFHLIFGIDQDVVDENHDELTSSGMNTEFIRYMK